MSNNPIYRASIGIFQRTLEETKNETCPIVPKELFEAVERVIQSKSTEVLKSYDSVYVIQYSETGPFKDQFISKNWLPIKIMKLKQWYSGGVTTQEWETWHNERTDQPTNS